MKSTVNVLCVTITPCVMLVLGSLCFLMITSVWGEIWVTNSNCRCASQGREQHMFCVEHTQYLCVSLAKGELGRLVVKINRELLMSWTKDFVNNLNLFCSKHRILFLVARKSQ